MSVLPQQRFKRLQFSFLRNVVNGTDARADKVEVSVAGVGKVLRGVIVGVHPAAAGGHGLLEGGPARAPHAEAVDEAGRTLRKVVLADVLVAVPAEIPGTPQSPAESDNLLAARLGVGKLLARLFSQQMN